MSSIISSHSQFVDFVIVVIVSICGFWKLILIVAIWIDWAMHLWRTLKTRTIEEPVRPNLLFHLVDTTPRQMFAWFCMFGWWFLRWSTTKQNKHTFWLRHGTLQTCISHRKKLIPVQPPLEVVLCGVGRCWLCKAVNCSRLGIARSLFGWGVGLAVKCPKTTQQRDDNALGAWGCHPPPQKN